MNILGISSTHDASVTFLKEGEITFAISEERLSRIKNDGGAFPFRSLKKTIEFTKTAKRDVDYLALIHLFLPERYFYRETALKEIERRFIRMRRKIKGLLTGEFHDPLLSTKNLEDRLKKVGKRLEEHFKEKRFLNDLGFNGANGGFYGHHASHAYPAFYYSGWNDGIVITADGMGDRHTHTTSIFNSDGIQYISRSVGPVNSPGSFYESVTEYLGFRPLRHEGKVTGLAAYGDPYKLYDKLRPFLYLSEDKMTFCSDVGSGSKSELNQGRLNFLREVCKGYNREDIAAAAQKLLEDVVLEHIKAILSRHHYSRIALAGGIFANVKLNQRIAELPELEEVFVFPAMSDAGIALGAALMAYEKLDPAGFDEHKQRIQNLYWGPSYDNTYIEDILKKEGVKYKRYEFSELSKMVAALIHRRKVVGLFQGRMEFGPRALGNRSILAAPTDRSINDWLNKRLERTEFMPFAPTVLDWAADDIFKNVEKGRYTARFMTITFDVYDKWVKKIPAVIHVDGTARPQIIARDGNPRYYQIIEDYYQLSGIPLVLNTSFNVHEEPIICKPEEAIKAFKDKRIDVLAIEDFLVEEN